MTPLNKRRVEMKVKREIFLLFYFLAPEPRLTPLCELCMNLYINIHINSEADTNFKNIRE